MTGKQAARLFEGSTESERFHKRHDLLAAREQAMIEWARSNGAFKVLVRRGYEVSAKILARYATTRFEAPDHTLGHIEALVDKMMKEARDAGVADDSGNATLLMCEARVTINEDCDAVCTLAPGHKGLHRAVNYLGETLAEWTTEQKKTTLLVPPKAPQKD